MNTVVDNAVCRCCSSEGAFKNIKGKYIWMGEEETYIDMLKDCYDIQIIIPEKLNHDLESGICELCITQLRNALNFRKQVLTTEEVFRKRFSDKIQLCESNCIKIEEPSDGLHDDDDGVVDALDFDINVSEVHEYEVPVKEEESEGEVSRSKRSKRTTRSSTIKIKRSKLDRAETSKCDSKKNDEKLQQKVKHLIKKKSKIKSEQDDDWTVSISKKADSDQGEQSGSLVGTVVKFLKPTKGYFVGADESLAEKNSVTKRNTKIGKREKMAEFASKLGEDLMKMRSNLKTILLSSNATPIGNHRDLGYTCAFCRKPFLKPADLKSHSLESHSEKDMENFKKDTSSSSFVVKLDITDLKCLVCDKDQQTLEQLTLHLREAHARTFYTEVKSQLLPFKFHDEPFQCYICRNVFSNFKSLQMHMSVHYRNYVCLTCDAGFVNRRMLLNHESSHEKGKFTCDYCNKVYSCLRKKKMHIKVVHVTDTMMSKCGYCHQMFRDCRKKDAHLVKIHGVVKSKIECFACDKIFKSKSALTIHTKRDHLMERKHQCEMCDKTFFTHSLLRDHMIVHSGTKDFQCRVCMKLYGRKKTLLEHMRIHKDDRRFKCERCSLGFVQKCSWKSHMKTKHGEIVK